MAGAGLRGEYSLYLLLLMPSKTAKGMTSFLVRPWRGMLTVNLAHAKAHFSELLDKVEAGEEVVITENQQPIAKLVSEPPPKPRLRPAPGLGKGIITILSDDDEHLKDFAEYMP